ncbi:hypothetical protein HK104_001885, partial [Borealophlyctis nickersoniae]
MTSPAAAGPPSPPATSNLTRTPSKRTVASLAISTSSAQDAPPSTPDREPWFEIASPKSPLHLPTPPRSESGGPKSIDDGDAEDLMSRRNTFGFQRRGSKIPSPDGTGTADEPWFTEATPNSPLVMPPPEPAWFTTATSQTPLPISHHHSSSTSTSGGSDSGREKDPKGEKTWFVASQGRPFRIRGGKRGSGSVWSGGSDIGDDEVRSVVSDDGLAAPSSKMVVASGRGRANSTSSPTPPPRVRSISPSAIPPEVAVSFGAIPVTTAMPIETQTIEAANAVTSPPKSKNRDVQVEVVRVKSSNELKHNNEATQQHTNTTKPDATATPAPALQTNHDVHNEVLHAAQSETGDEVVKPAVHQTPSSKAYQTQSTHSLSLPPIIIQPAEADSPKGIVITSDAETDTPVVSETVVTKRVSVVHSDDDDGGLLSADPEVLESVEVDDEGRVVVTKRVSVVHSDDGVLSLGTASLSPPAPPEVSETVETDDDGRVVKKTVVTKRVSVVHSDNESLSPPAQPEVSETVETDDEGRVVKKTVVTKRVSVVQSDVDSNSPPAERLSSGTFGPITKDGAVKVGDATELESPATPDTPEIIITSEPGVETVEKVETVDGGRVVKKVVVTKRVSTATSVSAGDSIVETVETLPDGLALGTKPTPGGTAAVTKPAPVPLENSIDHNLLDSPSPEPDTPILTPPAEVVSSET